MIETAQEDPVIGNLKLPFYLLTKYSIDDSVGSVCQQGSIQALLQSIAGFP